MKNLAPIGISTYSRVNHLKQTIDALANNSLAANSEVYIFSDGAKPGDEDRVKKLRNYLKTIDGFRNIFIKERERNCRTCNNRDGMRLLLDQYGKLIWLEEDIVTSPLFLQFMNHALDKYVSDKNIFSISGYRPPITIPDTYNLDGFVLPRFNAWGFGIWKDRFDLLSMKISKDEFRRFIRSPEKVFRFTRGGWDMLGMLHAEVYGQIDALDVKIFYQQFKYHMDTVYPKQYLVNNIGHDGSGLHCSRNTKFNVNIDTSTEYVFNLPGHIPRDKDILKSNYNFRSLSLIRRVKLLARLVSAL